MADVARWYENEILKTRTTSEGLSWNRFIKSPRHQAPKLKTTACSESEFMSQHVYDLYYKKPATSAKAWWQDRDSRMGGHVTLAL